MGLHLGEADEHKSDHFEPLMVAGDPPDRRLDHISRAANHPLRVMAEWVRACEHRM